VRLDLKQLRLFVTLAEELHFGRAAQRLHMDVSPLSRAIRELEAGLGNKLFDRSTRRTSLTRSGQTLLDHAYRILGNVEGAQRAMAALVQCSAGSLRLGLSDGVAGVRLARWLARLRRDAPDLDVQVHERSFSELVQALRSGQLDLGLTLSDEVDHDLVAEALWRNPLVVVLPADHPLCERKAVDLSAVLEHPLILYHPKEGSGCARQLKAILARVGSARVVNQVNSLAMVLTLVAAGYGIGFALRSNVTMLRSCRLAVRRLSESSPLVTFALRRSDRPQDAHLDRCLALARAE
jgi:DNA-binding transcriptional LysR family regulator